MGVSSWFGYFSGSVKVQTRVDGMIRDVWKNISHESENKLLFT